MANTRKKTAVERIKLSLWAKHREATKRALRQVAAKQDSLLVNTGQKKPQTGVVLTAAKAFANFIRAGFGAKHPIISEPQIKPLVVDQHGVTPVVAHPRFPSEDFIVRSSLSGPGDNASNLRALMETYNSGSHSGWKTKGRQ